MSIETMQHRPLTIGFAVTLGAVTGIVIAKFMFNLPKLMKGG
jgi:hypothetical protein